MPGVLMIESYRQRYPQHSSASPGLMPGVLMIGSYRLRPMFM